MGVNQRPNLRLRCKLQTMAARTSAVGSVMKAASTASTAVSAASGAYDGAKSALRSAGGEAVLVGASALVDKAAAAVPLEVKSKLAAQAAATSVAAGTALEAAAQARSQGSAAGALAVHDALNSLFDKLPAEQQEAWVKQKARLREQTEVAKAKILDMSDPVVDRLLDKLLATAKKSATGEPDLPGWVGRIYSRVLDGIWPDVRMELKAGMQGMVLR